jgi:hypothetical protein
MWNVIRLFQDTGPKDQGVLKASGGSADGRMLADVGKSRRTDSDLVSG